MKNNIIRNKCYEKHRTGTSMRSFLSVTYYTLMGVDKVFIPSELSTH